jgi:predicted amidohydrolase
MNFRVAGAQLSVNNESIDANVTSIVRAIEFASEEHADILITPEGSLSGYHNRFDSAQARAALIEIVALAKQAKLGLALGTCFFEEDGNCYNQIRFYNKDGEDLGFHSKILTCGFIRRGIPIEGECTYFTSTPLRVFDFHGITIGGLICNDLWANPEWTPQQDPHLSQQLAQMGARVIFHAVNGGRDSSEFSQVVVRNYHESNLQLRARAGGVWIVTVDNAAPDTIPNSSSSGVISPEGKWVLQSHKQGEQFYSYTITL